VKALLDVQLSPAIAVLLRKRGLDVDAVSERADIPDDTRDARLMAIAADEERAVVTNNVKDFRPVAARRLQRGEAHAGLILVPSTRRRTKAASRSLADAIEAVMRANPGGLAQTERWLD
jgi:predicted nuclease of predicted toxin-antitoxin system